MLDQDDNFYLISLNILVSCLLDNVGEKFRVDHFWELTLSLAQVTKTEFLLTISIQYQAGK